MYHSPNILQQPVERTPQTVDTSTVGGANWFHMQRTTNANAHRLVVAMKSPPGLHGYQIAMTLPLCDLPALSPPRSLPRPLSSIS